MNDDILRSLAQRRVSRRRVLAGGAAAAFLAACGGEVEVGKGRTGSGPKSTVPDELESELSVYNWAEYVHPKTYPQFEKKFDVTITEDTFPSNEDALAKLEAGAKGYDLVVPTGYMVQIMAEQGLLMPLDHSKIPNMSLLEDRFTDMPFDPGNKYSVAKDYGTTGFGYRADIVKEDMESWEDFFRLASKYSGRYTVLNSPPEVIGAGLKLHGYSYNTTDPKEIDEAVNEMIKIKEHIFKITSTMRPLMKSGEAAVSLTWSGEVLSIQADVKEAIYRVPTEGSEVWTDNWSVVADAPHPAAAHAFINWILEPKVQAQEVEWNYYGSCVEGEEEFLDPAIYNDPAIYPPEDVAAKLEVYEASVEAQRLRNEAWTKFKAA